MYESTNHDCRVELYFSNPLLLVSSIQRMFVQGINYQHVICPITRLHALYTNLGYHAYDLEEYQPNVAILHAIYCNLMAISNV